MAAVKLFDQPTTVRLHTLLENFRSGKLLLPEFQRPFVWKDEQRLLLFESILTGLPIGSLLIWVTTLQVKFKNSLDGFSLPAPATEKPLTYVLDGLQRVFTLYAALTAEPPKMGDEQHRWPIFLDLEADLAADSENRDSRFKLARRDRKPPLTWLPLSAIFHPKSLRTYQNSLYKEGKDVLAERSEEVTNLFKDYPLAIVPIITDDLNLATQSFERINSAGSEMGQPHMLRALTYTENFDLTQRFDLFTATLPWGKLDHQTLVNTLKALLGLSIYGADQPAITQHLKKPEDRLPVLEQMERGVRTAVEFLAEHAAVRSETALPYTYQLVALAYAAAHGANLQTASKPLWQWLWASTYTEYFTSMTAGQLRREFEHVRALCDGAPPLPQEMPRSCSPLSRFRWSSVRALAFMHLLARQKLVDEQGRPVDGEELLARGGETAGLLYPEQPASDPANRILVAPEHAAAVRRAFADPLPLAPALREAHVLPPSGHPATHSAKATLDWRRARLREMEADFIRSIGLEVRADEAEA